MISVAINPKEKNVIQIKIIKFKLDEDPLQRLIYFLTFAESLEMIFSHYKETCEVLLDYPKIGGENIKDFVKNSIGNLLCDNIDVYIRRLIAEFPVDGVTCIEDFSHIVPAWVFLTKVGMTGFFNKSHIKEGGLQ